MPLRSAAWRSCPDCDVGTGHRRTSLARTLALLPLAVRNAPGCADDKPFRPTRADATRRRLIKDYFVARAGAGGGTTGGVAGAGGGTTSGVALRGQVKSSARPATT